MVSTHPQPICRALGAHLLVVRGLRDGRSESASCARGRRGGEGAHLLHEVEDRVRERRVGERESLGVRLSLRAGGAATGAGRGQSELEGVRHAGMRGKRVGSARRTIVFVCGGLRAHTEITARGEDGEEDEVRRRFEASRWAQR